jgi:hypothetical protein
MINIGIERIQKIEAIFTRSSIENSDNTINLISSYDDIKQLSQCINKTIIVLDNLLVIENNSKCILCKGSIEVNSKLEQVKVLIEELQSALYKCHLEKANENNPEYNSYAFNDFYN